MRDEELRAARRSARSAGVRAGESARGSGGAHPDGPGVDRLREDHREAHRLGLRWSELRIGDPRAQWGSCTPEGVISLSWRLLLAPPAVFRYVVIHELCHLPHPDHSKHFWALVAQQMPDWSTQREWLKRQGSGLHRWLARAPAEDAPAPQADLFG